MSGRPPASEMTSGRSVMRHQVAHRRGLHDLRARGEEAGVALEVAALAHAHGVRHGRPRPLSSTVMPRFKLSDREARPRHLPGDRSRAAAGLRPFLPRCSSARSPPTTLGIDFDGTDFAFLESAVVPAGDRRRRSCVTTLLRPRLETPTGEAALGGHRHRARRAALRRHARRPLLDVVAGHHRRRSLCALSPSSGARSLLTRTRARLDAEAAARAARLRRGRRAAARRRSRSSSRPSRSSRIGFFVWLLARRPPPRGREVRRPAHPAVSTKLVLAVIDGLKPAMLERAVATGRAPALAAVMERGTLRRRVRRGVPVA